MPAPHTKFLTVPAEAAQHRADPRHAGVDLQLLAGVPFQPRGGITRQDGLQFRLRPHPHGAQFHAREGAPAAPNAILDEKDRAAVFEIDQHPHREHQGQQEQQQRTRQQALGRRPGDSACAHVPRQLLSAESHVVTGVGDRHH